MIIVDGIIDEGLLEKSPFLRILPPVAVEEMRGRMTEESYDFGDIIVAEGDPADSFYVLTNGRARVLKTTDSGQEEPLQRLRKGDSFGEIGLLSGGSRTATVRASEPTSVLRLMRDDFDDCMEQFPQMREFVELQLQNRMLQGFLQQYTKFARTPLPVLQRILQFLQPVEYSKGDYVIRENDPGGSVYIVEKGKLMVTRGEGDKQKTLAYLRPGDYFGELSLLQGMKRTATVIASTDCKLHVLAPEDWETVLDEYTELREMVQARIDAYNKSATSTRVPLDFAQTPENASIEDDEADGDSPAPPPGERSAGSGTRFSYIRQIDENDCGVASLAMACLHFGRDVSTSWIRSKIGTDQDGSGAKDICNVANEMGLSAKLVKHASDAPEKISAPCLLHTTPDHWVFCIESKNGKLHIADPARGVSWIPMEDITESWSGHAITLAYTQSFQSDAMVGSKQFSWMGIAINTGRVQLAIVCALMMLVAVGESMLPVFAWISVDELVDVVVKRNLETTANIPFDLEFIKTSFEAMQWRLFGMGAILVVALLLVAIQRSLISKLNLKFDRTINSQLFQKILSLPLLYFLQRSPIDLHRRLSGIREIRNLLAIRGMNALNSGCQMIVFTIIMLIISWQLTLAFIAILLPVYCCLLYFSGRVLRPAYESLHGMEIDFSVLRDEMLQGISSVKASGREQFFKDSILQNITQLDEEQHQSFLNVSLFDGAVQVLWLVASLLFLWVGAKLMLVYSISLSVGGFIALLLFIGLMFNPVQTLLRFWADWQSAKLLMQRINEVVEWPPEQDPAGANLKPAPTLQGQVEFRDVTVRFGGESSRAALSNLSFTAMPGQVVAIVGRSGSGKSVLCQTIASLLHPSTGTVLYDGVSSKEIRLQELRRQIGLVLTENRVFTGSVKSNIAFGTHNVSESRVTDVCRMVGILEQVEALPQGINTVINEHNHRLSSTLKQGIALARALYNDPSILVMDQISSALDVETESTFFENLDEAFQGRLVFIATKLVSIAKTADIILVLDQGQLVESGEHSELMSRRGLYYHLASRQDR